MRVQQCVCFARYARSLSIIYKIFNPSACVRYQPIHTIYYTLHTEHAYCLSYRFLNNAVITTVIEMVEMVEILVGRLGKRSVERVGYVINNLLHLVIVKYGDIPLVLFISTRLRLVTILSLLVKYLVILHADPCNKSYILHPRQEYFQRPKAEENILYRGCNICRYFTRKGFEYLVYYIGYSLRGNYCIRSDVPIDHAQYQGWNIEIYATPTNQFDWSVSRAYVINIYFIFLQ